MQRVNDSSIKELARLRKLAYAQEALIELLGYVVWISVTLATCIWMGHALTSWL